jgi:hypothetical protein
MSYDQAVDYLIQQPSVELSTRMGSPCLRYKEGFMAMLFAKENALIIKVSSDRVHQTIQEAKGNEFNFTKKKFMQWVLIPEGFEDEYLQYMLEALEYAKKQ